MLVEGDFVMEMLRPLDLQSRFYVEGLGFLLVQLVQKLPLALFAWLVFGLQLPRDPRIWIAFLISLLLGHAVIFLFNWIFACLAFYTTEAWGLGMVQQSVTTFFSGALIPLAIMPDWLQSITLSLPFAQALYVPVSLLSGITPVGEATRLWLIQIAWLLGLLLTSRLIFRVAVRKITVQGG
jgi:ABC-2 type transport system permease protein